MKYRTVLILVLVIIFIIPPVVFGLSIVFLNDSLSEKINPVFKSIERKIESPIGIIARDDLLSKKGEYGIYIKNLKTNEEYIYQKDKKFDSASLYKLWVMAVAYQKINDGAMDEDQILSSPTQKLEDTLSSITPIPISDGEKDLKVEEEFTSMKTSEAIEKMITHSDNYAALLVTSRAGNLTVANFIRDAGFINSNFKQPPQTSAGDIGKFYELLYRGEIVDEENSEKMIEALKRQALNDRIPKYLPEYIEVAHKTGELFGSKHDAGIVFSKKGDYIIVVLSDSDDPIEAAERIAKFSKGVFDYFNN